MFVLKQIVTIGTITEEQVQNLVDIFEEESDEDQDYWLNRVTLELLREKGDAALAGLIEAAMGDRDEIEIVWVEE